VDALVKTKLEITEEYESQLSILATYFKNHSHVKKLAASKSIIKDMKRNRAEEHGH
jgi:hypothetical protein